MDLIDRQELIRQIRLQSNRSSLGETSDDDGMVSDMFNRCSLEHMRKSELIDLIIAMCGKQIPKQPHYYKENPHCKCGYVITAGDDYCRKCGVRIDWSE